MISKLIILVFAVLSLISAVWGELVLHKRCGEAEKCTVHQVWVNPCAEAPDKPCKLKRGKSTGITVDITPGFSSESLHSRAYWANGIMDLPFLDMETDACKTTQCPIVEGNRQNYTLDLKLSSMLPTGIYNVKWKLSGENDEDECCFLFKLQLK